MQDKIAAITGASGSVGSAFVRFLASRFTSLILIDRNIDLLAGISQKISASGVTVRTYKTDLMHEKDIDELVSKIQIEFTGIDILVHSAGIIRMGTLASAPVQQFDSQYRINVRAPYLLTQSLLPMLKISKGQIVFINSSAGLAARANISQYAATKFALKAIADSLREEVNQYGVRVLSVYLGRTAGSMQVNLHQIEGKEYHPERLIQPDDISEIVIKALELPRSIEVTDIHLRPMLKP
jgi:NADP-dependent 3-hydroxy acid dehydrogenase YdfG